MYIIIIYFKKKIVMMLFLFILLATGYMRIIIEVYSASVQWYLKSDPTYSN
jgi:hypothetical protein